MTEEVHIACLYFGINFKLTYRTIPFREHPTKIGRVPSFLFRCRILNGFCIRAWCLRWRCVRRWQRYRVEVLIMKAIDGRSCLVIWARYAMSEIRVLWCCRTIRQWSVYHSSVIIVSITLKTMLRWNWKVS